MTGWLHVVGIGAEGLEGLTATTRVLIRNADLLVGGARHLNMAADTNARKVQLEFPLDGIVSEISAARNKCVVVLATGDPMSFGIGSTLTRHFEPEDMMILPAPGAFSLAAARLGWPLHGCTCLTLHGRPLELLNAHILPGRHLLILSHDGCTPKRVADTLTAAGFGPSRITALENMGTPYEARHSGTADGWTAKHLADLNTVAVECRPGPDARYFPLAAGLPDDAFVHDGQMTKRVVRAATIAALAPRPGAYLWDLGAGCGSVAIEWLRAAQDVEGQGARATAVEREAERCAMIATNASRLGTPFLDIVTAENARAIGELDDPDAVFLGGGLSEDLLAAVSARLKPGGRLAANAVTIEGEQILLAAHAEYGGELTRIAVSHAEPVGVRTGWRPAMPVTQWSTIRT
jgi:precorrin-6Y C5,15-methyltransferase (decarboxylating)